jgi:hypothetical protein
MCTRAGCLADRVYALLHFLQGVRRDAMIDAKVNRVGVSVAHAPGDLARAAVKNKENSDLVHTACFVA